MGNDNKTKLITIINFWMAHNEEHSQEFKEWAEKARAIGENEAGGSLLDAAGEMDRVNSSLSRALNQLTKKES